MSSQYSDFVFRVFYAPKLTNIQSFHADFNSSQCRKASENARTPRLYTERCTAIYQSNPKSHLCRTRQKNKNKVKTKMTKQGQWEAVSFNCECKKGRCEEAGKEEGKKEGGSIKSDACRKT